MFSATPTPPPLLLGESCGAFGTSKKAPQRPPPPHQRPEVSTNHLGLGFWRESPPKRRCVSAKGSAGCREAGGHRRAGGQRCGDPRRLWEPRAGLRAAAAAAQGGSRCHPLVLALLESPGTAEKRPEGSAPQTPGEFLQQGQGVCCYQLLLSAAFPNISCFSAPKKLFPFFFFPPFNHPLVRGSYFILHQQFSLCGCKICRGVSGENVPSLWLQWFCQKINVLTALP